VTRLGVGLSGAFAVGVPIVVAQFLGAVVELTAPPVAMRISVPSQAQGAVAAAQILAKVALRLNASIGIVYDSERAVGGGADRDTRDL